MKFRRWKKMIVMIVVATMFLQSVVVNAEGLSVPAPGQVESMTDTSAVDSTNPDALTSTGTVTPESVSTPTSESASVDSGLVTDPVDEVSAEVKAFLEAVAKLPAPEKVTKENAEEIGQQVKNVLAMKEAITPADAERDDVKAALETVKKVDEAVQAIANAEQSQKTKTEESKAEESKVNEANKDKAEESKPSEGADTEETEEDEVPAEVKAFLEAVAAIPAVTLDSAAEVGEYVYGPVSDAYAELLGTEYENRDDVQAAVDHYAAAIDAVDAALGIESGTFEASGTSLFSRTYHIYDQNFVEELEYGRPNLKVNVGVNETWTDEGEMLINDKGYDIYKVTSWNNVSVWSTNEKVLKVTVQKSGSTLKIVYEGISDGTASVRIAFDATTSSQGQGIYGPAGMSGAAAVSGCTFATVTVGTGVNTEPDFQKESNLYVPAGYSGLMYFFTTDTIKGSTYACEVTHVSNSSDNESIAKVAQWQYANLNSGDGYPTQSCIVAQISGYEVSDEPVAVYVKYSYVSKDGKYKGTLTDKINVYVYEPDAPITLSKGNRKTVTYDKGWLSGVTANYNNYDYGPQVVNGTANSSVLSVGNINRNCDSYTVTAGQQTGTVQVQTQYTQEIEKIGSAGNEYTVWNVVVDAREFIVVDPTVNPTALIKKTVNNATPKAGDKVTYTVTVTNPSQTTALTNLTVTDVLDRNLTVEGVSDPLYTRTGEATISGSTINWSIPRIGAGATALLNITVKVKDDVAANTVIPNAVSVKSGGNDITPAAGSDPDVDVTVIGEPTITKTHSKDTVTVGEEFTYSINVANPNDTPVTVKITDVLDDKLTFVEASNQGTHSGGIEISGTTEKKGGTVTWTNVTVPASDSATVSVTVKGNTAGTVVNSATITLPDNTEKGAKDGSGVTINPTTTDLVIYKKFVGVDAIPGSDNSVFKIKFSYDDGTGMGTYELTKNNCTSWNGSVDSDGLGVRWIIHNFPVGQEIVLTEENATVADKTLTTTATLTSGTATVNGQKITVNVPASAAATVSDTTKTVPVVNITNTYATPTTYILKYDANGGKIRKNDDSATTMTDEANSFEDSYTFTVKTASEKDTNFDPTWAGHTLLGWADTAEEANAGRVKYRAGNEIRLTKDAPTKTIFAVWKANTPDAPKKEDLDAMMLGVQIVCDVTNSGHAVTRFSFGAAGFTAGEVTANTGADKDAYPFTCTVNITVDQQNDYWLGQTITGTTSKWNADHKLLDNAATLTKILYWNGTSWTDLDTTKKWHYMVIHTEHKPTELVIIKKFEGVTEIPEGFAIEYTIDDKTTTLNANNKDDDSKGTTFEWTVEIPKDTKLELVEKNATVTGKTLKVEVTGDLANKVTVDGTSIEATPSAASGSTGAGISASVNNITSVIAGSATRGFVSGGASASATETVLPSITVTNTYEDAPSPVLSITKEVNKASVKKGGELLYTITVTNSGTVDANNVVVTDQLPKELGTNITNSNPNSYSSKITDGQATFTWELGTIEAGGSKTVTFMAEAKNCGKIENNASVTSDEVKTPVETEDPAKTVIYDLIVTKSNGGFQNGAPSASCTEPNCKHEDDGSGKAHVHYTVTVQNVSGFNLYGLDILDDLTTVVKADNVDVNEGYELSIENVKLDGQTVTTGMATPVANGEATRSIVGVLEQSEAFADQKTVTLTYDFVIENTGDKVLSVELKNKATGGTWTTNGQTSGPQKVRARSAARSGGYDIEESAESGASMGGSGATGTVKPKAAAYKVEHYQQNVDGNGYTLKETENLSGTKNTEVTATPKNYEGFTENTTYQGRVPTGTVNADGNLVLKLYYDRDKVSYTVKYLKAGTEEALSNEKTVDDQTFGATVNENAITIPGYTVDPASKELTLGTSENVIVFYYTEEGNVIISYEAGTGGNVSLASESLAPATGTAKGSIATAETGYTFDGWYSDDTYQTPVNPDWVKDGEIKPVKEADEVWTNATYYAKFTPNEAKIVFEENGGSNVEDMTGTTDKAIIDTAMPTTTREGYTFDGWYANEDLTGKKVETLPEKFPAGTTTYYAKWTKMIPVTVNYVTDKDESFGSISYYLQKGDSYDHGISESVTEIPTDDKADANAKSPEKVVTNGHTYLFDKGETQSAMTGTIGADVSDDTTVTITVVYTLDDKGKEGDDPDNTPDGIPDKYQAKVVYRTDDPAKGSVTVTGTRGYVTLKDANGNNSTTGKVEGIAATAADPTGKNYFENWTATATDDSSFSYTATTEAALGTTIANAQGGAVYTFTAHFEAKIPVTITIVGNNNPDAIYDGNEKSVTGYNVTEGQPSNTEVKLVAGETAEVKGTDVGTYYMGLDENSFELTGEDAYKYIPTFVVTDGFLTIAEKGTLSVSAGNVTTTYDGEGHPVTPEVNVDGATVTVVYVNAEGKELRDANGNLLVPVDAGTYTAKITATLDGYDEATNKEPVKVTINRRSLIVTTASDSKTYDGTALRNSTATVTGAAAGDTITATANGSQTVVGNSANGYIINWGTAKESNYTVTAVLGTLTVNPVTTPTPDPTPDTPDPTPVTPPTPPTPVNPTPVTPVNPTPVTPVNPTPVTPVNPTPVTPVNPTPVTANPTPVQPTTITPEAEPVTPEAEIDDANLPLAEGQNEAEPEAEPEPELMEVGDMGTPLAEGKGAKWALINFALMNLAIFESIMLLIGYFVKTKDEEEEEERKLKKKGLFRILSVPVAVISLIAFILTEDITLPTGFVDKYTILMLIIAIVQTVAVALSKKKYEDEDEAQKETV